MKKILLLLLCFTQIALSQNVEEIGKKVLATMQQMADSWKKVKEQQDATTQGAVSMELAKQLTLYAEELKQYPRPDNATRTKIKATRAKEIEKISLEMANTLVLIDANAPLMSAFTSELNKIKVEMDKSSPTFNAYFEPDAP